VKTSSERQNCNNSLDARIEGKGKTLLQPIFDAYQIAFIGGNLHDLARSGKLYKYGISPSIPPETLPKTPRPGFLPDTARSFAKKTVTMSGSSWAVKVKKNGRSIEAITEGNLKSFEHLAAKALNVVSIGEGVSYRGIQAMGVLKAMWTI
jgi:hypothetical protein